MEEIGRIHPLSYASGLHEQPQPGSHSQQWTQIASLHKQRVSSSSSGMLHLEHLSIISNYNY